ncbi:MAG TPA: 5-(carboxyamino)imidazole ribonucleotide synthase [Verrucomicrobiae bacterium]|nr:5-(carboxyamino)imidazole ribonucleotide synthase [Verrucomicrobiae bacterium]
MHALGIIGGGQLGRMIALDAKRMGYHVVVLEPQEHSPAGQVADEQIVAAYEDKAAIEELGKRCDVVTYEFENVAIESVEHLEALGHRVAPASGVLRITQDRLLEKRFVRDCGVATADFDEIERVEDLASAAMRVGFPAVLKTARGGYDGKGQWRANTLAEAHDAFAAAKGARLIFERFVPFVRELSVIATRGAKDDVVTYPVAENTHDGGILVTTVAPARVEKEVAARAAQMAATIGHKLGVVGTYCVEFFLTAHDELLVNEIAPRPHNSGHYTIDATQCSQYEQHVRAICGLPLARPMLMANAVMINILGEGKGDYLGGIPQLLADPSIVLHLYGKKHAVARRKMGHFTMLLEGPVDEMAIARARAAREKLAWAPDIPALHV